MLFGALLAVAGFLLGLRAGLALGYRAERGRRIIAERTWLSELSGALDAPRNPIETVDATRARLLAEVRARVEAR